MSVTILHRDEMGEVRAEGNELFIEDRTVGDPVALCFHSNNETKGKISIRQFVSGAWREIGFVGFKADERGRTDPAHRNCLEMEVWSKKAGDSYEDPDYERVFAIRHDGFVAYKGGTLPSVKVTRFYTDGGKFCINWQDDTGQAAGIVYSTNNGSQDESTWVAVGKVRIDPI